MKRLNMSRLIRNYTVCKFKYFYYCYYYYYYYYYWRFTNVNKQINGTLFSLKTTWQGYAKGKKRENLPKRFIDELYPFMDFLVSLTLFVP